MNHIMQFMLLATAFSTSSNHGVIRKAPKLLVRGLIPLVTSTRVTPKPQHVPPARCFLRKPKKFVAEVVTQVTFDTHADAQKLVRDAKRDGATQINWFATRK